MLGFKVSPLTPFRLVRLLTHPKEIQIMSAELDALSQVIAAAIAVNKSAAALIPLLSASGKADKAKLVELAEQLSVDSAALDAVVKDNTPDVPPVV
jgi:uncharacterized membrane protein affecting hemolysin expression